MKQSIYLILFASFFGNWISSPLAFAKTYTGRLDKANGRYYIYKNNTRYELTINNSGTESVLLMLKPRDFVSIEGTVIPAISKNKIAKLSVNEINYIGLNDVLGFWQDASGFCYYFSSFTSLKTFFPNQKVQCNDKSVTKSSNVLLATYNYFINPYDASSWSVLISSGTEQYFAELSILDYSTQKLILYNSYDGSWITEILLYRVVP